MVSARRAPLDNTVIAIVGPTATGKSELAEALAFHFDGEIISADSMQVYTGMDVGTAKVPAHKRGVAYHCLDVVNPNEDFDVARYQSIARAAIEDIWARDKQPLICGGTGLYVRAALDNFELGKAESDSVSSHREERRQRLQKEADELGAEAFYAKLANVDSASAALIHPHNVRRVVRAFEWLEEGSSYAEQASGFDAYQSVYPTVFLGLDMPREELYARINERVVQMMEKGLLEEVRGLLNKGYGEALTAQQAIGYKELVAVLSGEQELDVAVVQIQQATRQYAKRQKSWFRRDNRIQWLDARLSLEELTTLSLQKLL